MTTQSQPVPGAQPHSPLPRKRAGRPDNHVIVIFGATGDLAKRKLLPGLFDLAAAGLMPERYRIIGSAPAEFALTDEAFRAHARQAAEQFGTSELAGEAWDAFAAALSFGSAEPGNTRRWRPRSPARRRRSAGTRACCSTSRSRLAAFDGWSGSWQG